MTEKSAVRRFVSDVRRDVAPDVQPESDPQLHIHIAAPTAKVFLLPGHFRDAAYVRRHVEFVLTRSAEQGEQHVRRNLGAIRMTLEEMGIDDGAIQAELRTIEAAVRAEIWKQVLLPDGDE
ncbi:DUF6074 family protein [Bradyrhizobium sp. th.b2]|uniref:DUF6074 family protein n=1 Tax=Bradyrhizobium sp. th-b2 TaxID=172088 RepID=UPI00048C6CA3|nr:DUF6074 family protein [Bradyrhizobium sp. th.b2]